MALLIVGKISSTRTCILRPKTAGHISKSKGHLRGCHDSWSLIFQHGSLPFSIYVHFVDNCCLVWCLLIAQ